MTGPAETRHLAVRSLPAARRVLVVDDEPMLLEIAEHVLCSAGYEVAVAGSGSAAIELLTAGRFDAVVLDVTMPAPDGWATLVQLRRCCPDLKVLMASGYSSADEAVSRGAGGFIPKPYTPQRLLDAVTDLFAE